MENDKNECFRCQNFDRYFTKGVKRFNEAKCGWCCKKTDVVNIHDSCSLFVLKTHSRKRVRLLCYYLNDILTEISEIRYMIEGEQNNEE